MVRRELGAIEQSLDKAWARMATSAEYIRALLGESEFAEQMLGMILDPDLRADPRAGAAWAAHLLDPAAFSQAVSDLTFPEYIHPAPTDPAAGPVDEVWAQGWQRARQRQVEAGIVTPQAA